jgi:serine/threonine protein kinase
MIGTQIGNYRIVEKLGEGGMGVVYKGVDIGLDRPVAIKVLSPEFSHNPELVQRFQAEAKAQAYLSHFNLATLYAFLADGGNAVMVMEFVDGETFAQMIARRGPIPAEEAIPLFKQALLGIGTAHRMGVVHRDIKPSNLMLNKNGIVKVMDFGIAKIMGARGMTRTGIHVGTVAYMSPEQIQNRSVDIRSDIYALGVTLYEMLSGRLPFEADNDFQIMHDHVHTPPPSPRRFYPYIPEGVENVVLKALAKQPDERLQSVEEFGAALDHPERVSLPAPGIEPPGSRGTVLDRASVTPAPGYSTTPLPGQASSAQAGGSVTPIPAPLAGPAAQPTSSANVQTPRSLGQLPQTESTPPITPDQSWPHSAEAAPGGAARWNLRALLGTTTRKVIAAACATGLIAVLVVLLRPAPPPPYPSGPSVPQRPTPQIAPIISQPTPADAVQVTPNLLNSQTQPAPPSIVAVPFDRLQVTHKVYATYPQSAIRDGIVSGGVRVAADIDEDGRVVKVAPRSGVPVLYGAAETAAGYWRFEPYQESGKSVKVRTEFEVPFKPVQFAQVQQPQPQQTQTQQPQPQAPPAQTSYQTTPAQVPQPRAQTQPPPTPPVNYSGNFATRAIHRVRLINGQSHWCTGNLVITRDGQLSYRNDASTAAVYSYMNVCRGFSIQLDNEKHVSIDPAPQTVNGYQFVHLHLEKGWAHKEDLYVPAAMADALQRIVNPWLR